MLYVGYTDYVRIGPLVVQHGYRTGLNAAKNHLIDAGGQISTMAGHVHKTSDYEVRGEDFTLRSIVLGCFSEQPSVFALCVCGAMRLAAGRPGWSRSAARRDWFGRPHAFLESMDFTL